MTLAETDLVTKCQQLFIILYALWYYCSYYYHYYYHDN